MSDFHIPSPGTAAAIPSGEMPAPRLDTAAARCAERKGGSDAARAARQQAFVPLAAVSVAERVRRRETAVEQRIRRDAPSAQDAASALLLLWRNPDRFPALARAAQIERAFRARHPRLEAATLIGAVINPLTVDTSIPATASHGYVLASQIGTAVLVLWPMVTIIWTLLALQKMSVREQLPGAYSIVSQWADPDPVAQEMEQTTLALTAEYVRLRDCDTGPVRVVRAAVEARTQLRHLALLSRKHAAALAAANAAADAAPDGSTALVPSAVAEDLAAEFAGRADQAATAIDALRMATATAVSASKMRSTALPEPTHGRK